MSGIYLILQNPKPQIPSPKFQDPNPKFQGKKMYEKNDLCEKLLKFAIDVIKL